MTTTDLQNAPIEFTKQRRLVSEFQSVVFIGAMILYGVLGYSQRIAHIVSSHISNFYFQVALCWLPLGFFCIGVAIPGSCYNFFLHRKFGLAKQGIGGWLRDFLKASAIGFVLYAAILEIAYASHGISLEYGWLISGFLAAVLYMALARCTPWILSLFYPVIPLERQSLRKKLVSLAIKAGVNPGTILEWRIAARTRQANALVAGIGASRRILLTDTLISELSEDEVEALVAHEFGHCAHHHVAKRLLFQAAVFSVVFLAFDFFRRAGILMAAPDNTGWTDLALIPGVLFWWYMGHACGSLAFASLSRKHERQADLYSWKLTGRAGPFISGMRKLTALNLIAYEKGAEWRYTHPATSSRIAAAEKFSRENGEVLTLSETTATPDPA